MFRDFFLKTKEKKHSLSVDVPKVSGTWKALCRREVVSYIYSPWLYMLAFFFVVLTGQVFTGALQHQVGDVGVIVEGFFIFVLFICPILSARSFSEERVSGTQELLLTFPLTLWELVLSKFLGTLFSFSVMLLPTLFYPFFMHIFSVEGIEWGVFFSSYLGIFLMGMALLSVGFVSSAYVKTQVGAGLGAFGVSMLFLLIDRFFVYKGGVWSQVASELSLLKHFGEFPKGIVDLRHVAYYFLFTAFMLFLTRRVMEFRKIS